MPPRFSPAWAGMILAASALTISGCSKKSDDFSVAPPPPPKTAEVALTQPAPAVAAPNPANGQTPALATETGPANMPPATTEKGLAAITKGMTEDEVKEFKESASIEDFDTNLQMIQEAVNAYYNEHQKNPPTVDTLMAAGFLNRKPIPPKGKRYVIDNESGEVSSVKQ